MMDHEADHAWAGSAMTSTVPRYQQMTPTLAYCSCGHRSDGHDRIAARYCAATLANQLRRGCICNPAPDGTARVTT
jgi:hypothetical protein